MMQAIVLVTVLCAAVAVTAVPTTMLSSAEKNVGVSVREPIRPSYRIRFIPKTCELIDEGVAQRNRKAEKSETGLYLKRHPRVIAEAEEHDHSDHNDNDEDDVIVSIYATEDKAEAAKELLKQICPMVHGPVQADNGPVATKADVFDIVISGDPSNRIDVVLMGDAYTASMVDEYLDDMTRMTNDMFSDVTFASYLPVFNIWGVYSASVADHIGVNGQPENTRYRLYRDGTELRGVYCASPNNARADCQATGQFACDFPSLIGRDEYYGGLGGEFTISTRSITSGTKVLRHEMGHNFASVGEEYEGGSSYFGANFAPSLNVGWEHWLTEPRYPPPAQQDDLVAQDYAWYDLADGAYTIRMTSTGDYSRRLMRFTVSGCEEPDSLLVTLDGVRLNWTSVGTMDRSFYEFFWPSGFTAGSHALVFQSAFPPSAGNPIRQLCSVTFQEFRDEDEGYTFDNQFIGAYPVRRSNGAQAGYRPNHETCLMRNMTSRYFCVVCQETMWMQFLEVMDWIDDVTVISAGGNATVTLEAVKVGQLREVPIPGMEERYVVSWTRNGVAQPNLNDLFTWTLPTAQATGSWRVTITYETTEVRNDPDELMTATTTFTI